MKINQPTTNNGGTAGSIVINTTLVTGGTPGSVLFVGSDTTLAQDNSNFFWDDTNNRLGINTTGNIYNFYPLTVGSSTKNFANSMVGFSGTLNAYLQVSAQNYSAGILASTDFVAQSNTGTDGTNYVDMGITSSTFADPAFTLWGGANAGYLFNEGPQLTITTMRAGASLVFGTGGTLTANTRLTINGIGTSAFTPAGLTGTQATSGITLTQTLNTSGTPTVFKMNVTNTASNSSSLLMDLQAGSGGTTSEFSVGITGNVIANGNFTADGRIKSNSDLSVTNKFVIASAVDGNIRLTNNTTNDFGLLQLGGTSSSFPALKRNGVTVQHRLADDTAFCFNQGKLQTDTNATTGLTAGVLAALTNATIVIYDATGQAYRVPCII